MEGLLRPQTGSVARIALACLLACLAIAPSAHAATIFSDGFEAGSLSSWSSVRADGGGGAWVQSEVVRGGSYALRLSGTSSSSSYAYARRSLSAAQNELTVAGDV
ncbi:MAG TPA: hypothetical protein VGV67_03105, partial [Solirubrobacteraceae bacterium]|nr:hypothetical protein [Solirubrobacteraceae bacterium]